MKIPIYTNYYDASILKKIKSNKNKFTAKEHSLASKIFYNDSYKFKEDLLFDYVTNNNNKLTDLEFILNFIKKKKLYNIVSLGSGKSVQEYIMSLCLNEKFRIYTLEYDSFFVSNAKNHFSSKKLKSFNFDFFNDKILDFLYKKNIKPDLCIFFGSSYVMDDSCFIKLFSDLKLSKTKYIIDLYAGFIDYFDLLKYYISYPFKNKKNLKFHGYARNKFHLRKLYKNSNLKILKELNFGSYRHVSILK